MRDDPPATTEMLQYAMVNEINTNDIVNVLSYSVNFYIRWSRSSSTIIYSNCYLLSLNDSRSKYSESEYSVAHLTR